MGKSGGFGSPGEDMNIRVEGLVACSSCGSDMGVVSGVDEDSYVQINNTQDTAYVGYERCGDCDTVVFRAHREIRLAIRL